MTRCAFIPPYVLAQVAESGEPTAAAAAEHTLSEDLSVRGRRELRTTRSETGAGNGFVPRELRERAGQDPLVPPVLRPRAVTDSPGAVAAPNPRRSIHDAKNRRVLPGSLVRSEGQPATTDISVTEAYDGLGATWELFHTTYGRDSLDAKGLPLVATVHFDRGYDNAFWDGEQMVFGDGDGIYFDSFTSSIDIMGHELAHGFTQYTAGFVYVAQPGALNESVSDVFGSLVKQRSLAQSAGDADWLIGAGLFTPRVQGVALRSMIAPGTAYDDPVLGKDPQPADMDSYVVLPHDADNDNGGVHINSGIPNRAFALAAIAMGGPAWEGPGRVWFDTMTNGRLPKDCDFVTFAKATIDSAERLWGAQADGVDAIREAWASVKVLTSAGARRPARR